MNTALLEKNTVAIIADHKGILAADESTGTIKKRFDSIGLESTEENRRAYRELLFTAPDIEKYIGGVILYDETIRQATSEGENFAALLMRRGIAPGIKVDLGTKPLDGSPDETATTGLDGLGERLKEYRKLGATFAKWRAVIKIAPGLPTEKCIEENARALAAYAKICQENDIVPIVEPEVLMDGANTMQECFDVTSKTLAAVFAALTEAGVVFSGMLLKPNMVVPGMKSGESVSPEQIADRTVECLQLHVPEAVPGIVFLSGGQSEAEATLNLQTMNARHTNLPWKLSYSYGRALQASTLKAWQGKPEQVTSAQAVFSKRARLNSLACTGKYVVGLE